MTVPAEKATANYVPAAAVIRRLQALSGFTGCKVYVDRAGNCGARFWVKSRNESNQSLL